MKYLLFLVLLAGCSVDVGAPYEPEDATPALGHPVQAEPEAPELQPGTFDALLDGRWRTQHTGALPSTCGALTTNSTPFGLVGGVLSPGEGGVGECWLDGVVFTCSPTVFKVSPNDTYTITTHRTGRVQTPAAITGHVVYDIACEGTCEGAAFPCSLAFRVAYLKLD